MLLKSLFLRKLYDWISVVGSVPSFPQMVMLYGILQTHSVYLQVSFIIKLFVYQNIYDLSLFFFFFPDCDKANMKEQQQRQQYNYKSQENFPNGEVAENTVKKKDIRKFISGWYLHVNQ